MSGVSPPESPVHGSCAVLLELGASHEPRFFGLRREGRQAATPLSGPTELPAPPLPAKAIQRPPRGLLTALQTAPFLTVPPNPTADRAGNGTPSAPEPTTPAGSE